MDNVLAIGYNAAKAYNKQKLFSDEIGIFAIGSRALEKSVGQFGQPDDFAVGHNALANNTTGILNTAVGNQALFTSTTGLANTALGFNALYAVTTGNANTAIGNQAGNNLTTGTNNIVIGGLSQASDATVSNEITLGNSSNTSLRCAVTSITSLSDARDKTNIEPLNVGLNFINSLNPVKFEWNMRDGAKVGVEDFGFIAQDIVELEDSLNSHEWLALTLRNNPDKLEATQGRLIPILVKAIQELTEEVNLLKNNR
jgi:hypothetical protein